MTDTKDNNTSWQYIFLAMIAGFLFGNIAPEYAAMLKPLGDVFVNLIKMIVVPLVFFSISAAIISMEHTQSLGRIGGKSVLIYLVSTAVAICIALTLANVFNPAAGLGEMDFGDVEIKVTQTISFSETLVSLIPTNPLQAMSEGNILQVISFAVFLGIAINFTEKKVNKIEGFLNESAEVFYSLTGIIMKFAPYGIFGLISWVVSTQEPDVLKSLVKVIFVVVGACLLHTVVVYSFFVAFLARLNPLTFFRKIVDAQIIAFSTSSSSATLPITIKVAEEKLGVSKGTAKFVLPLGSTVNMDGTAIYLGICAVFVAGLVGVDLSLMDYLTIVVTATLASIGAAGIPGVALVMMSMIFTAVGLPLEAIAMIAGIDRILDMVRTTVNVTGDLAISVVIDRSEGAFNEKIYNS